MKYMAQVYKHMSTISVHYFIQANKPLNSSTQYNNACHKILNECHITYPTSLLNLQQPHLSLSWRHQDELWSMILAQFYSVNRVVMPNESHKICAMINEISN